MSGCARLQYGPRETKAFTVKDFHDLIRIIDQRPEWRGELRRVLLTEELLALPEIVRELAESQKTLAARMAELTQQVRDIAVSQHSLVEQGGQLAEAQLKTERALEKLKGHDLKRQYRERSFAYFSRLVRGAHTLTGDELFALLSAAVARGAIPVDEEDEVMRADAVVRGKRRPDGVEVYLVVEVSWGVGADDVRRAVERAQTLAKAGLTTMPVVAGESVILSAQRMAQDWKVWQVTDGHAVAPPE